LKPNSKILALILVVICSFTFSCKDSEKNKEKRPPIGIGANNVATATGYMGLDLLKAIYTKKQGETVLISPLSIQTTFNITLEAAQESTFDQISSVLHYDNFDLEAIRSQSSETANVLVNQSGHPSVTIANAFFYDPSRLQPKTDFINALNENYSAHVATDNFAQQQAVDNINQWVKNKTKGLIEKIIESISNDELAFIVNAIHFKSDWLYGFDENSTSAGNFKKSNGSIISVDFMSADWDFSAAFDQNWLMVDLPFKDSTFSLSLVRPTNENNNNWLADFSYNDLELLYAKLHTQRVYLTLPRMNIEFDYQLSEPLIELGMVDAFSESLADFTKMGTPLEGPRIFITRVEHSAVLKVDEKGAEGAAVTTVGFGTTSIPPTMRFDTPYLLSLRHIPSGAVLFMGFVEDPEK
jgi:serine protease inhibitor